MFFARSHGHAHPRTPVVAPVSYTHLSITSSRPEFLARVHPECAVISCGLRNRYGHPRPEVLKALETAKVRTFSTDINGAACFRLDGKNTIPDLDCGWRTSHY